MSYENFLRQEICNIGKRLWQLGFTPCNAGNICVRIKGNEYLATPTGVEKGLLTPDMILRLKFEADKPEEERITVLESFEPYALTSEIRVHLVALNEFPNLNATIHAHAPYSGLYSMLGRDKLVLPDNFAALHSIPIVPWQQPGSWPLAYGNLDALRALPKDKFCIMGLHGPFTMGTDLYDAYMVMQKVENAAQMAYLYETYTATVKK